MKKKAKSGLWYVVVWAKRGRLEPGVYSAQETRISGDKAFVLFRESSETAHVLPKENVFRSEEQAIAFYTSQGSLKWVVLSKRGNSHDVSVHQAFVKRGARSNAWHGHSRDMIRLKTGEIVDSYLTAMIFDTEGEAKKAAHEHYTDRLEEVEKELRDGTNRKTGILAKLKKLGRG